MINLSIMFDRMYPFRSLAVKTASILQMRKAYEKLSNEMQVYTKNANETLRGSRCHAINQSFPLVGIISFRYFLALEVAYTRN